MKNAELARKAGEQTRQLMRNHFVSGTEGFLSPPTDLLQELRENSVSSNRYASYFYNLETLSRNIVWIITHREVEHFVNDNLANPPSPTSFDYGNLSRNFQHAFMLRLAMIMHAYLKEKYPYKNVSELMKDDEPKTLCSAIAIPMWELSKATGIQPSMSYSLYALWNWKKKNPLKPLTLANVEMPYSFTGTVDEKWFVWIHQVIEATVATGIEALLKAYFLAKHDPAPEMITPLLQTAARTENRAVDILQRMREKCDYKTYFDQVRLFYTLPKKIIFENVAELEGKPMEILGETGGQSPSRHFRLMIMDITHSTDAYFPRMRLHMSAKHQELLDIISDSNIRRYVLEHGDNSALLRAHNSLIQAFVDWRIEHLFLVRDYIKTYGETHGTGKPPLDWLEKLIEETKKYIIDYK
ncbi:MAG: hypothetical protein A2827_02940 [Candidatus Spechtbacteria bacterium RIFCSPHIGHO2_01_FULL_43_30]|uniref:Indoleamine 2,3-dioxygenase n=1 Tax=Candidatus Spechtbacteria bacterium RIFCSPHIGHO2_01_FULL_43_30 TaxID=1802158 RepID=A0A1G2H6Q7_9BACT|nr:MAG: hypothetical protein A2827_02940 [Candidatus Spechtbacteria bacterium RIFCSPHIGHO2_01_FULL_43_30]